MRSQPKTQNLNGLRFVTQRLSASQPAELLSIAPRLAQILNDSLEETVRAGISLSVSQWPLQKLITCINTLLQDNALESQYVALLLIKPLVETNSADLLKTAATWCSRVVRIFGNSQSYKLRELAILCVTRVIERAQYDSTLTREVTTPLLPTLFSFCVKSIAGSPVQKGTSRSALQSACLMCIDKLLLLHPASFRPFKSQLTSKLLPLLAATSSDSGFTGDSFVTPRISHYARRCFVSISVCAPKSSGVEARKQALLQVIESAQNTADRCFRAVIEESQSFDRASYAETLRPGDIAQDEEPRPLPLPGWKGLDAGLERLCGLLQTLESFLVAGSLGSLELPVGNIVSLLHRIICILPASESAAPRTNPEINIDEKETLFAGLSVVHAFALRTLSLLVSRLGHESSAICFQLMDTVLWNSSHQTMTTALSEETYAALIQILHIIGPSVDKASLASLSPCLRLCCEDLMVSRFRTLSVETAKGSISLGHKKDSQKVYPPSNMPEDVHKDKLRQRARALLLLVLTNLQKASLPSALRQQIDRVAVLTNDRKLLLTSVANPAQTQPLAAPSSSLLPLLARAYPRDSSTESLLRPIMPCIPMSRSSDPRIGGTVESDIDDQDSESECPVGEIGAPATVGGQRPDLGISNGVLREPERPLASTIPPAAKRQKTSGAEDLEPPIRVEEDRIMTSEVFDPLPGDASFASKFNGDSIDTTAEATSSKLAIGHMAGEIKQASPKGLNTLPPSFNDTAPSGQTSNFAEDISSGSDFEMPILETESIANESD